MFSIMSTSDKNNSEMHYIPFCMFLIPIWGGTKVGLQLFV